MSCAPSLRPLSGRSSAALLCLPLAVPSVSRLHVSHTLLVNCVPSPPRPVPHTHTHTQPKKQATANCPYSTLGVAPNSSDNEIKQAYRKLVLQYHPDVAGTGAERKFMSIQQAYELLTGKSHASGGAGASVQHDDWNFNDCRWLLLLLLGVGHCRWVSQLKALCAEGA